MKLLKLWLGMLYAPQWTLEQVLQDNPLKDTRLWLTLVVYIFLILTLSGLIGNDPFDLYSFTSLFGLGFFFLLVLALAVFSFLAQILKWSGKCFGGKGSFKKLFAVQIWASVPYMYILIFGAIWFSVDKMQCLKVFDEYSYLRLIFSIWTTVLLGLGIAKAHEISTKKGLLLSFLLWGVLLTLGVFVNGMRNVQTGRKDAPSKAIPINSVSAFANRLCQYRKEPIERCWNDLGHARSSHKECVTNLFWVDGTDSILVSDKPLQTRSTKSSDKRTIISNIESKQAIESIIRAVEDCRYHIVEQPFGAPIGKYYATFYRQEKAVWEFGVGRDFVALGGGGFNTCVPSEANKAIIYRNLQLDLNDTTVWPNPSKSK